MGADGGVYIYNFDKIAKQFGRAKAERLAMVMPNSYVDKLDGETIYLRCYTDWGEHMFYSFKEPEDWCCDDEAERQELSEAFKWAEENANLRIGSAGHN